MATYASSQFFDPIVDEGVLILDEIEDETIADLREELFQMEITGLELGKPVTTNQ